MKPEGTPPAVGVAVAGVPGCDDCDVRLREGLAAHAGVMKVTPAGGGTLQVLVDPHQCSPSCLDAEATRLRSDLHDTYSHDILVIEGMDCANCARGIERAVARVGGVSGVSANFPASTLAVEYLPAQVDVATIREQVARLGYDVAGHDRPRRLRWPSPAHATISAAVLTGVALALTAFVEPVAITLFAAAIVVAGGPIAVGGLRALQVTHRPEIKFLMTIAVIGAIAIGAWSEAALVVVLFSIGELLEVRATDRARRELAGLVALAPDTARVRRRDGTGALALVPEVEVPAREVLQGDVVIVRPGERIPVDGVVREGASAIDQSPITGESLPVDVSAGAEVFAGTLNQQGLLGIEATRAAGNTTLDRIATLVSEAQARRSPSERWVDAFARWYTPTVIVVALVVSLGMPVLGASWGGAFYDALALLILACPCALVLSTPVTIVSALARASATGSLIKGGAHLEAAASVQAVALDKTGTLTMGAPRVASVVAIGGVPGDDVLALAAGVEAGSAHPLARAIGAAAGERGLAVDSVTDFTSLTGLGARGRVGDQQITVGDPRLFDDLSAAVWEPIQSLRAGGQTVVVVEGALGTLGLIGIEDTVRPEAAEAVAGIHALGLATVMLTGDSAPTAAAVAERVGIDTVHAGLMPEDKAAIVAELPAPAMVGDGVNDAPALAAATVGIAMGAAGSDTAIEVSDIAILGDDLRAVPGIIALARWTRAIVRQNIGVSLATKGAAVALLAFGTLPLWGAVLADVGASLIVVANGLRLLRGRPIRRTHRLLTLDRT